MAFAENTTVPVERTRAEIERLIVSKHKCESFQSGVDFINRSAVVQFKAHGRFVRFTLALPNPEDKRFRSSANVRGAYGTLDVTHAKVRERVDQESRRAWRALLLVIKAKLEAVESRIASFEEEFLAHIVMPNDMTIGAILSPMIETAYESGQMPRGLLALPAHSSEDL